MKFAYFSNICIQLIQKIISFSNFLHLIVLDRRDFHDFSSNKNLSKIVNQKSFKIYQFIKSALSVGINLRSLSIYRQIQNGESSITLYHVAWLCDSTDIYYVATSFYNEHNQFTHHSIYGTTIICIKIYTNDKTISFISAKLMQKNPYQMSLFIRKQIHYLDDDNFMEKMIEELEQKVYSFFMRIFTTSIILNALLSQKVPISQYYVLFSKIVLESNENENNIKITSENSENDSFLMLQAVIINKIVLNHIYDIILNNLFNLLFHLCFKSFHFNSPKSKDTLKIPKISIYTRKTEKEFFLESKVQKGIKYIIDQKIKLKQSMCEMNLKRSRIKRKRYLIKKTSDCNTTLFSSISFSVEDLCQFDSNSTGPVLTENRPLLRCLVKYVPLMKREKNILVSQPKMMRSKMSQVLLSVQKDLQFFSQNQDKSKWKIPLNYCRKQERIIKESQKEVKKRMEIVKSRLSLKKVLK